MSENTVSSGAERGQLNIRRGQSKRLIESQPYEEDATKVFTFLEFHLCSETFEILCRMAQERFQRKEAFLDYMYRKHQGML